MSVRTRLIDFLRTKEEKVQPDLTSEQKSVRITSRQGHQKILERLKTQYESLAYELRDNETNVEIPRSDRERVSKRIITKLTFLKYEIDIREDLSQWL